MIMNRRSLVLDHSESSDSKSEPDSFKNSTIPSVPRKRPENLSPFLNLSDPRVKLSVERARPKTRYPNLAPPRASSQLSKPPSTEDKAELDTNNSSSKVEEKSIPTEVLEDPSLFIVRNLPRGVIDALAALKTPPEFINKVMTKTPVFLAGNKNPQLKRKLEVEPSKPVVHIIEDPYFSRDPLPNTTHLTKASAVVKNFPLYDPSAQPGRRIVSCSDAPTLPAAPMGSILPCYHSNEHRIPLITPQTMRQVLDGSYSEYYHDLKILDCRFEYEFEGGHLQGALNFSDPRKLPNLVLNSTSDNSGENRVNLMIIYCEYSMDRAPKIAQKLRNLDETFSKLKRSRECKNLKYPELYILDGGYATFYEQFPQRCEPSGYTPMDCREYRSELAKKMLSFNHRLDRLGLNLANNQQ